MIARLIPWWLFAIVAISFGLMTFQMATRGSDARIDIDAALAAPAPDPVALTDLDDAAFTPPLGEFAVTGFDFAYVGPYGDNQTVLFLHSSLRPGVYVALTEYNPMGITVEGAFEALDDAGGAATLRGVLRETRTTDRTFAALVAAEALPPATVIYMADILRGDRQVALEGYRQRNALTIWIPGVFAAACAVAALVKFRAWRRRRVKGPE